MAVLDDFVHEVSVTVGESTFATLEQRIRVLLQPKPRWWPQWFYDRMVRRLLIIESRQ